MNDSVRAPNMVPRGSIRLSEAFERFCRQIIPQWDDFQQLCVQWDESRGNDGDERGEDPYHVLFVSTDHAETVFRSALRKSHLRAYIHNFRTGIDLELNGREWAKTGENVGGAPDRDRRMSSVARHLWRISRVRKCLLPLSGQLHDTGLRGPSSDTIVAIAGTTGRRGKSLNILEEFALQFASAMNNQGPRLIEVLL